MRGKWHSGTREKKYHNTVSKQTAQDRWFCHMLHIRAGIIQNIAVLGPYHAVYNIYTCACSLTWGTVPARQ